jgi:two-component system phosphate regulon sensor histidine kinase PhoR
MLSRFSFGAPTRLATFVVLLTAVPLAGLGWLAILWLAQERDLEQVRLIRQLDQTAALLAREVGQTLAAWEALTARTPDAIAEEPLPAGLTVLAFDDDGVRAMHGEPLLFLPAVSALPPPADQQLRIAERSEYVAPDLPRAAVFYRRAAQSADPGVRAGALVGLARTLRARDRVAEALDVYEQLTRLRGAAVAGFPAELIARRERMNLLARRGEARGAEAERAKLASLLRTAPYIVDRATFDAFAADLPDLEVDPAALRRADAVAEAWPAWRQPAGRTISGTGTGAVVSLWRAAGPVAIAVIAPLEQLMTTTAATARGLDVSIRLDRTDGTALWGSASAATPTGSVPLADVGLAAVLRVRGAPAANGRRSLLAGAFALLAFVIAAAAYVVFRSVRRELSVAQLQSEFVATVSHEFRSPLTAMRHLTETLEDGAASAERLPDYYRALGKETRRLQTTVETVLDFGRLDSGRRTFDLADIDAREPVRAVVEDLRAAAAASGREIVLTESAQPARVHADRDALMLAVRNLIDNALKYSPAPAPVAVWIGGDAQSVAIAVQDRGPGLPATERRDVFRKFVRGSAARAMNVKGTGLGLAMVDRIVRAHGGRVRVDSALRAGSTFTIALPRAVSRREAQRQE